MSDLDIRDLLASLRADGGDSASVEVKRAHDGWPNDLATTVSAFANTPGGGLLVLGVDERTDFAVVGVYDAAASQKALASVCRQGLDPPVRCVSRTEDVDERVVVVAEIAEADPSEKPVRLTGTRRAYLRSHDGDFELSELEVQAFLANRSAPTADRQPVSGADRDDLDDELVSGYVEACRGSSSSLSRFEPDELLRRTGVLVGDDVPSVAGLLALGIHPQEHLPSLVIQAHVRPGPDRPDSTRALDVRRFDGPLPRMLADALAWVRRNTATRVEFEDDGHGRDAPEYPAEAIRELLSNALVHRDLGEHSRGRPISLHLESSRMVLSNPGGLFGITTDRLGRESVTSARNATLIRVCQNVRFAGDQRVSEALASGIPRVLASLRAAEMTPPAFFDQGIRFTVSVPNHALLSREDLHWLGGLGLAGHGLSDVQRHALAAMRGGRVWTNGSLRSAFPMDSRDARRELSDLVERGLAAADGERGGRTYRLRPPPSQPPSPARQPTLPTGEPPDHRARILERLASGSATVGELATALNLSERQVRHRLGRLRDERKVELSEGGVGRRTTYALASTEPDAGH